MSNVHFSSLLTRVFAMVLLVFTMTGCPPGPSTFRVSSVSFSSPDFVPAGNQFKAIIHITFTGPVKQSTLSAPGTVKIDVKAGNKNKNDIAGTFIFSGPADTVNDAVLISNDSLADIINPQAGENLDWTVLIRGNDAGSGVVTDASGAVLDGDSNNNAGGDFEKTFTVIG